MSVTTHYYQYMSQIQFYCNDFPSYLIKYYSFFSSLSTLRYFVVFLLVFRFILSNISLYFVEYIYPLSCNLRDKLLFVLILFGNDSGMLKCFGRR